MQFNTNIVAAICAFTATVQAGPINLGSSSLNNVAVERAVEVYTDNAEMSVANPLNKRAGAAVEVYTDGAEVSVISSLDRRDVGAKADAVSAVGDVVSKAVRLVQQTVDSDIRKRQRFTQEVVAGVQAKFPGRNVVVCNVGYTVSTSVDLTYSTGFNAKLGSDVTFDVIVFGKGTIFTRRGDGGYENWAYSTWNCANNGAVLDCR